MTTTAELALLRTYPQRVEMRMSIFQPTVVLTCQVNNVSGTRGDVIIPYDSVVDGSYLDVEYGMTMLVGTAPGLEDVGRIRVRSITSTYIKVAMNSKIAWADGLFLTILYFFDVVPVFPKIVEDPDHPDAIPIFYKDEDIAYTNQNNVMGTLICMGSHREAELRNGTAQLWYSSSGTYNVNGDPLTYVWEFEGGTPGLYSGANPGYVSYSTPGNYVTKLRATSHTGASGTVAAIDYSYRYIIINPEGSGGNIPNWELTSLQGSRDSGGYTANIVIRADLGFTLTPGTPVILSTREWYGSTQQNIGNQPHDEVFFVGYILNKTINYDYEKSSVTFQIGSISEIMKMVNGFAISVEDTAVPKTWYQVNDLNLRKAAYHFWKWHSTVLLTTDVQYLGSDFLQQFFDSSKESIYDGVAGVLKSARVGELVSDRVSKLWMEISARATPNAVSYFPPDFTITKDDWIGEPAITEAEYDNLGYLEMNGIAYTGPGEGGSTPLIACAPGDTPSDKGKFQVTTGLSVYSQAQLNALVGDVFYNTNAKYPAITLPMRGTFKNFDIAPQIAYTLTIERENGNDED